MPDLIRHVWDNRGEVFNWELFDKTATLLIDALTRGWKGDEGLKLAKLATPTQISIDYDSPDYACLQMFELNLFQFSAAKTAAAAQQLNELARDNETFSEFNKKANKLMSVYNENFLRTEYDFAHNTASNAAKYHRLRGLKNEFPTWQYLTAGDDRVREAHRALHGKKFKADDPAFDSISPPNGWGCRCYIKPLTGVSNNYTTKDEAERLLAQSEVNKAGQSEWDRMIKYGFNVNRAKVKQIFDKNKMYVHENLGEKLSYKDQGMKAYSEMDRATFADRDILERDKAWATAWHDGYGETAVDYAKRRLTFSKKTVKSHLTDKYIHEGVAGRQNTIELVPEVLKSPDEVYLFDAGSVRYKLRYIKYYCDYSMSVVAEITDDRLKVQSWYNIIETSLDAHQRNGVLIKRNPAIVKD